MFWRSFCLASLAVLAGCGGQTKLTGTPEGTCTLVGGMWSCVPTADGGAPEGGSAFALPQCPSNAGSGSCSSDTTVDTTNPNEPAHYSSGDCFQCTDDGLGVHWLCTSQGWQSQGIYSCQ